MFEFFDQILSFFSTLWQFFVNFISNIIVLISAVSSAVQLPIQLSVYMPMFIGSAMLIAVSIWVVKLIIGR